MTKYCEIFKTGVHKDASGAERVWTSNDLDKIVSNYNENKTPAPIVVGHPKANNPAYGWVEDVKREGETLYASFKQVNPEFAEWVNKGLYKNRSISLYPDLKLRHVGFLGAQPPAVKGLEEFQFSEEENTLVYDFSAFEDFKFEQIANVFQRLRDFLIDKYDLETANQIINTWSIEDLKTIENKNLQEVQSYCEQKRKEQDLTILKQEGQQAQTETTSSDFSEELKVKDTQLQELQNELDSIKIKTRKAEFEQFAEQAIKDGHITPAQKSFVVDFCEICHGTGEFEFAEGDEKSAVKNFQEFLSGIKQVDFSEMAKNEGAGNASIDFSDPVAISKAITEYRDEQAEKGVVVTEGQALNALKRG